MSSLWKVVVFFRGCYLHAVVNGWPVTETKTSSGRQTVEGISSQTDDKCESSRHDRSDPPPGRAAHLRSVDESRHRCESELIPVHCDCDHRSADWLVCCYCWRRSAISSVVGLSCRLPCSYESVRRHDPSVIEMRVKRAVQSRHRVGTQAARCNSCILATLSRYVTFSRYVQRDKYKSAATSS